MDGQVWKTKSISGRVVPPLVKIQVWKIIKGLYCEGNSHRNPESMVKNREIIAQEAEKVEKSF